MPPKVTDTLWTLAKLAVAGASIFVIGWAILVFGHGGDIQRANADILSLSPVPLTNTAKFENSLEALGHEEPRVYNYNGNEVGFSTRYVRGMTPRRLVEQYQRAFVRQGLNEEAYLRRPGAKLDRSDPQYAQKAADATVDRAAAMMSGQIVPLEVHDNYAAMGAGLIAGMPTTRRELREELVRPEASNFDDLFAGYRMIEIFRDPSSGATAVTAAWSRGNFDMNKHRPDEQADRHRGDRSLEIPRCMGCTRTVRFSGESNAKPDAIDLFETPQIPRRVANFYDEAMADRGWVRTPENRLFDRMVEQTGEAESGTIFRQYRRGEDQISIRIRRDRSLDKTTITAYQSK